MKMSPCLCADGQIEATYHAEVAELLNWVGLGDRMNALPVVLSGGEKQRAAIARALIVRPELLLADEPTGNVNPIMARRLLRLFIELHKSGTAVVIATHDIGLMDQFAYARRLVVGDSGLTVFEPEKKAEHDGVRQSPKRIPLGFRLPAGDASDSDRHNRRQKPWRS